MSLWAVNVQLGQILPYVECGSRSMPAMLISLAAAGATLACGWVSWCAAAGSGGGRTANQTVRFTAHISALLGLVFTFVLLLQAASALLLTGCER